MVFNTRGMMRKLLKGAIVLIIFFVITIPSFNVWFWFDRQNYYTGVLPTKLEISGSILTAGYGGLSEGCFFAVYKLSDKTLNSINQEGLTFFNNATKSRTHNVKENQFNMYHSYAEWQKTPISYTNKNGSFGSGLECAKQGNLEESLGKKIKLAANSEGSFYTGHREGQLVVIPSLGVAVISGAGG
jgi:hypothetical protein